MAEAESSPQPQLPVSNGILVSSRRGMCVWMQRCRQTIYVLSQILGTVGGVYALCEMYNHEY